MIHRLLPLGLLALLLATLPKAAAQEQGAVLLTPWADLKWRQDYHTARKEAHDKGKPLIIDFGTAACFWCKKLDDTTFRDPRVVALMNERFIPLKIDAERDVQLANYLRVESYPTLVLATSDGKILANLKGYQDAETFHDILQRLLINTQSPDWLQRDFDLATQKMMKGEYAIAIPAFRAILEEPKGRTLHALAQKYLSAIEQKAMERLIQAREMQEKGQANEAIAYLTDTTRYFPGLEASRQANALIAQMKDQVGQEQTVAQRSLRARDLLAQAREFYKNRDLVPCMERCSALQRDYLDMQEGQDALILMSDLKSNPALLQQAADTLSERLGEMYLALAESHLQKGQSQRAEFYLQRVVLACPGSRHAESAQVRLTQLQGLRSRSQSGLTSVGNPE